MMIEELKLKEDVIYDVYEIKKLGYVGTTDMMWGSIGMVGARSRMEALEKARKRYCSDRLFGLKPNDIIVILRSEVNYKPAKHPMTVSDLEEWQGSLMGITPKTDRMIMKARSNLKPDD